MSYKAKFEADLISAIKLTTGQTNTEIMSFFNERISECIDSPPNYTHDFRMCSKGSKGPAIDHGVWLVRGYYPNTGIMFKITVIENKGEPLFNAINPRYGSQPPMQYAPVASNREAYYAKIVAVTPRKDKYFYVNSNDIITKVAENTLLDSRSDMDLKVEHRKIMTPKGVKPCLPPRKPSKPPQSSS